MYVAKNLYLSKILQENAHDGNIWTNSQKIHYKCISCSAKTTKVCDISIQYPTICWHELCFIYKQL